MAVLHAATLSPTKAEILAAWLPVQSWSPDGGGSFDLVGAYRFDDPDGRVGLETHIVRLNGVLLQIPLTYRDAPLTGADDHLVGTMQHSALGDRWVYDGFHDPIMVRMLAAATVTGCGQAIGMVERDGQVLVVPPKVRLFGSGWFGEPTPVDGFTLALDDGDHVTFRNQGIELCVARRLTSSDRPAMGLTATWPSQDEPVVIAQIRDRSAT